MQIIKNILETQKIQRITWSDFGDRTKLTVVTGAVLISLILILMITYLPSAPNSSLRVPFVTNALAR